MCSAASTSFPVLVRQDVNLDAIQRNMNISSVAESNEHF